jgi:gas vesicle protein
MQCDRLIKQIKSWYIHVKDETMAPARMVSFIERHIETCDVCLNDPDLKEEVAKITELILPESKIPKAVRQQNSDTEPDDEDEEEVEDEVEDEEDEVESIEDDEEDEDELGIDDSDSRS